MSGEVHGTSMQFRDVHGGVTFLIHQAVTPSEMPPAMQLPSRPTEMANRTDHLERLVDAVAHSRSGDGALVLICGPRGTGKSALALEALYRSGDDEERPRLYADLEEEVSLVAIVKGWLGALRVASDQIPVDFEGALKLWRSVTRKHPAVVLLEGVTNARHITRLKPARGILVVTSRKRLEDLAAEARPYIALGPLDEVVAVQLLSGALAGRDATEAELVALARACDGIPALLMAQIGRLIVEPELTVGEVAAEVAQRRLAEPDRASELATTLSRSIEALHDDARRAIRLLCWWRGDVTVRVAAAVLEVEREEAARLLELLIRSNLLIQRRPDRCRIRHEARQAALALTPDDDPVLNQERDAAIAFGLFSVANRAATAELRTQRLRRRLSGIFQQVLQGNPEDVFPSQEEAWGFLDDEAVNIIHAAKLARDHGRNDLAYALAECLWGWVGRRRPGELGLEIASIGFDAARDLGLPAEQASMLCLRSIVLRDGGEYDAARAATEGAVRLADRSGDLFAQASAWQMRGEVAFDTANPRDAVEFLERSRDKLRQAESIGLVVSPRAVAMAERILGRARAAAGQIPEALEEFKRAFEAYSAIGDRDELGRTLTDWARALLDGGAPDRALEVARRAITFLEDATLPIPLAHGWLVLAEVHEALGHHGEALHYAEKAVAQYGKWLARSHRRLKAAVAVLERLQEAGG